MTRTYELIRRVILRPYCQHCGPVFTLDLLDPCPAVWSHGRPQLAYRLHMAEAGRSVVLFEGCDYGPSPMDTWDGDACVAGLLGVLTLRPGDMAASYFESYTPEQLDFCDLHAEVLAMEAMFRFEEVTL